MPDSGSGAELDLRMPPAHAREAVHAVDDDSVSAASYALYGDRVATQACEETIVAFRLALRQSMTASAARTNGAHKTTRRGKFMRLWKPSSVGQKNPQREE
ncbi:MAG: hypothetical protein ABI408_06350 [Gemmatimonadaceae bacterium]